MELRISSVCDDVRSAGGACPFFFPPLPLRLLVVLTSTGLSYLTSELCGGIMILDAFFFCWANERLHNTVRSF